VSQRALEAPSTRVRQTERINVQRVDQRARFRPRRSGAAQQSQLERLEHLVGTAVAAIGRTNPVAMSTVSSPVSV
jgi:hypothetical protein